MPSRKLRVLVVDDAVVVRKIVGDVLEEDPAIEVAATAPNGRIALQKLTQVNPDVVTLDVEMPELGGIETLRALRRTHPELPVIMFSTLTERGATATIEALVAGASDYVTKPANVGSVSLARQRIRDELIPKLKSVCRLTPAVDTARGIAPRAAATTSGHACDIVAIGVSTGGPNALAAILPQLPASFPVPIVLVQHMPPVFTRLLAERLDSQCALRIREAADGDALQAGCVYIAPGDHHLVVRREQGRGVAALNQRPPENSCRPAVDVLFRSVADAYGAATLGVVLTGMGQDGLLGCEVIKEAGGSVIAQDEATSVVWGMPGFVSRAGLADEIVPLREVAATLLARAAMTPCR